MASPLCCGEDRTARSTHPALPAPTSRPDSLRKRPSPGAPLSFVMGSCFPPLEVAQVVEKASRRPVSTSSSFPPSGQFPLHALGLACAPPPSGPWSPDGEGPEPMAEDGTRTRYRAAPSRSQPSGPKAGSLVPPCPTPPFPGGHRASWVSRGMVVKRHQTGKGDGSDLGDRSLSGAEAAVCSESSCKWRASLRAL